jgi:hypothetical protein
LAGANKAFRIKLWLFVPDEINDQSESEEKYLLNLALKKFSYPFKIGYRLFF